MRGSPFRSYVVVWSGGLPTAYSLVHAGRKKQDEVAQTRVVLVDFQYLDGKPMPWLGNHSHPLLAYISQRKKRTLTSILT